VYGVIKKGRYLLAATGIAGENAVFSYLALGNSYMILLFM
jgi:hypothetical protein